MRVTDRTDIAAPPEAVWAVTVDVERWHERTPTVGSVKRLDSARFGRGRASAAGSENTLRLDAGPLAWLLWPVLGPAIRRALAEENRGLKHRCEAG